MEKAFIGFVGILVGVVHAGDLLTVVITGIVACAGVGANVNDVDTVIERGFAYLRGGL